jgi:hypothetical protein
VVRTPATGELEVVVDADGEASRYGGRSAAMTRAATATTRVAATAAGITNRRAVELSILEPP